MVLLGISLRGLVERISGGREWSLQLNNIVDGFGYRRELEFFLDSWVIDVKELSDLVGDSDNKGEGSFKEQNNSGHLCEDIGS